MIELVISGGQTGVDQAGWRAGKATGFATGGFMPWGWLTETLDGKGVEPHPEFEDLYGARQHLSRDWTPRTRANVEWADLTLILFRGVMGRGTKRTMEHCRSVGKPFVVIFPAELVAAESLAYILRSKHRPRVLNVAGSRESGDIGIGAWAERYLMEVFRILAVSGSLPA